MEIILRHSLALVCILVILLVSNLLGEIRR